MAESLRQLGTIFTTATCPSISMELSDQFSLHESLTSQPIGISINSNFFHICHLYYYKCYSKMIELEEYHVGISNISIVRADNSSPYQLSSRSAYHSSSIVGEI